MCPGLTCAHGSEDRGWDYGLRIRDYRPAWQAIVSLDHYGAVAKPFHGFRRRDAFDLDEVGALVRVPWIQEKVVQPALIAEQEKPLGVHIETPERINTFGEAKFGKGPLSRLVRGELT